MSSALPVNFSCGNVANLQKNQKDCAESAHVRPSPWFPFFPRPVHVSCRATHTTHTRPRVSTLTSPCRCTRSFRCCERHIPTCCLAFPSVSSAAGASHLSACSLTSRPYSQGPPGPSDILYEAGSCLCSGAWAHRGATWPLVAVAPHSLTLDGPSHLAFLTRMFLDSLATVL